MDNALPVATSVKCHAEVLDKKHQDESLKNLHFTLDRLRAGLVNNDDFNKDYISSSLRLIGYGQHVVVFELFGRKRRVEIGGTVVSQFAAKFQCIDSADSPKARDHQLIKEFFVLHYLYKIGSSTALVGIPKPVQFLYLSNDLRTEKLHDLCNTIVVDLFGTECSYAQAFSSGHLQTRLTRVVFPTFGSITSNQCLIIELVGPSVCQLMQYCGIKCLEMPTALKLMDQLLCRLAMLHTAGIVHLDLQPENLCIGKGCHGNTIYLVDYTASIFYSVGKAKAVNGHPRFQSHLVDEGHLCHYAMDLEAWYYVLIDLLAATLPWDQMANAADRRRAKQKFWEDRATIANIVHNMTNKTHHSLDVLYIIGRIHEAINEIISLQRQFLETNTAQCAVDSNDSRILDGYLTLRKLTLKPFGLTPIKQRQLPNRHKPMFHYCHNGRDWQWEWDLWFLRNGYDKRLR